jgi:hypothetical protein
MAGRRYLLFWNRKSRVSANKIIRKRKARQAYKKIVSKSKIELILL